MIACGKFWRFRGKIKCSKIAKTPVQFFQKITRHDWRETWAGVHWVDMALPVLTFWGRHCGAGRRMMGAPVTVVMARLRGGGAGIYGRVVDESRAEQRQTVSRDGAVRRQTELGEQSAGVRTPLLNTHTELRMDQRWRAA